MPAEHVLGDGFDDEVEDIRSELADVGEEEEEEEEGEEDEDGDRGEEE